MRWFEKKKEEGGTVEKYCSETQWDVEERQTRDIEK